MAKSKGKYNPKYTHLKSIDLDEILEDFQKFTVQKMAPLQRSSSSKKPFLLAHFQITVFIVHYKLKSRGGWGHIIG